LDRTAIRLPPRIDRSRAFKVAQNRALGALIAVTGIGEVLDGVAHSQERRDLGFDLADTVDGQALDVGACASFVMPEMRAFDKFIEGRKLTAHQHEFVDMLIDHLTARGVMDPRLLYESPFTDFDPLGVAGVFKDAEVVELIQILRDVQGRAAA
jgi:hypothetical protein